MWQSLKLKNRVVKTKYSELNSVVFADKGSGRNGRTYEVVLVVVLLAVY